jgi:hypothetical protein
MQIFLTVSASCRPLSVQLISAAAVLLTCTLGFADPMADQQIPPSPVPAAADSAQSATATAEILARDKPLWSLQATIKAPQGEMPSRIGVSRPPEPPVFAYPFGSPRMWMCTPCEWDAPATRHLPLYFEDANLERMGYTQRWYCDRYCCESDPNVAECIQPVISGAHFVGRIPLLPLMMCRQPPLEPIYTLGVDRPGSPLCYRSYRCPLCLFPPRAPVVVDSESGLASSNP